MRWLLRLDLVSLHSNRIPCSYWYCIVCCIYGTTTPSSEYRALEYGVLFTEQTKSFSLIWPQRPRDTLTSLLPQRVLVYHKLRRRYVSFKVSLTPHFDQVGGVAMMMMTMCVCEHALRICDRQWLWQQRIRLPFDIFTGFAGPLECHDCSYQT